jgi:hypothetical protein
MMNQAGANIQYPYHDLPLVSTHDRIGFWALLGIIEDINEELYGSLDGDGKEMKTKKILDCGTKREDEK